MNKRNTILISVFAFTLFIVDELYLKKIVQAENHELLNFASGFLLAIGVIMPFRLISFKRKSKDN